MIVKRHFTPTSVWLYVRLELALAAASSVTAWLLVVRAGWTQWTLPVVVATALGAALSILLAVRVNTSYQRWWEGSAIWAQIVGLSRNVVRVAVSVSNSKPGTDPKLVHAFQHDVVRRQIAYATALRAQLRGHADADLATQLARLDPPERDVLLTADNKAILLLAEQSARIFTAYRDGLLTGLDNFQIETALPPCPPNKRSLSGSACNRYRAPTTCSAATSSTSTASCSRSRSSTPCPPTAG